MRKMNERVRRGERGFNLIELMIASTVVLVLLGGAAMVGVQLQRKGQFQEQVMAAQASARAVKEQVGAALLRAGAGIGPGRVNFGGFETQHPVRVRTGFDFSGDASFALPAGQYAGFVSDALEIVWGRGDSTTELRPCGVLEGGDGSKAIGSQGICTMADLDVGPNQVMVVTKPTVNAVDWANAESCVHVVTSLPASQKVVTTAGLTALGEAPSGEHCNTTNGGFWSGPGTAFMMGLDGVGFRVNWKSGVPVLELDPDGPMGAAPYQPLSGEVERLRVRLGVRNLFAPEEPLTWFPDAVATRPAIDDCLVTTDECLVPGDEDGSVGGDIPNTTPLETVTTAVDLQNALMRRVRLVEVTLVTRSLRRDLEAVATDTSGDFLLDDEGFPRDGYKRRQVTFQIMPRNFSILPPSAG